MADDSLDILIRTTTDPAGARATINELNAVKQAGQSANRDIAKETEALTVKKHDLHAAIKGLKGEFPELAHFAHLALNPIAFVVAGIASAFAIWNYRMTETVRLLSEADLPDNFRAMPGHVGAASAAMEEYAKKIDDVERALDGIGAAADIIQKRLKDELDLRQKILAATVAENLAALEAKRAAGEISEGQFASEKSMLEMSGIEAKSQEETEAEQKRIKMRREAAEVLGSGAQKKKQQAMSIHVASAEDDQKTLEQLKAQAEVAKKDLASESQRSVIGLALSSIVSGASPRELLEARRFKMDNAEGVIRRYEEFQKRMPNRNRQRDFRDKLMSESASDLSEAFKMRGEADEDAHAFEKRRPGQERVALLEEMTKGYGAIGDLNQKIAEANQQVEDALRSGRGGVSALMAKVAQLVGYLREIEERVRSLEGTRKANPPGI